MHGMRIATAAGRFLVSSPRAHALRSLLPMSDSTNTPRTHDAPGGSTNEGPGAVSLKRDVKALGSDAKAMVTEVAQEAKKVAADRLDTGKGVVAEGLRPVVDALRSSGEQLRGSPASAVSGYVGSAADMVEGASRYLEEKSVGEVVGDVESFARREPLIFLGGTFAVGFMLGRFLKASAPAADARRGQRPASAPRLRAGRADASSGLSAQRPALRHEATGLDRLAPSAPSSLGQAPTPAGQGTARITSLGADAPISSSASARSTAGDGVDPLEIGSSNVKKPRV